MSAPRFHNLESGGLQSRLRWWVRSPAGKGKRREWPKPLLGKKHTPMWVCLKMGYTPNEIAIFHRDNDHENHWVFWGLTNFQTNPCFYAQILNHAISSITASSSETTKNLKLQYRGWSRHSISRVYDHHWPFEIEKYVETPWICNVWIPPWLSPHINGNKNTMFITWSSLKSWAKPPNLGETSPTADLAQYRGREAE